MDFVQPHKILLIIASTYTEDLMHQCAIILRSKIDAM